MVSEARPGDTATQPPRRAEKQKVKRLWLASGLAALSAPVAVAFVSLFLGVLFRVVLGVIFNWGEDPFSGVDEHPISAGMGAAVLAGLFNWYIFWLTVPITTLIFRASLGRMPGRGILHRNAYLRWGAIWGALLVSAPAALGGWMLGGLSFGEQVTPFEQTQSLVAAGLMGALIGMISGLIAGGLFVLIVRPSRQVQPVNTAIFA